MGIARQGDRWLVIARVRVNGKIVQRRETIDGTREAAKRRFEQLKHEARQSANGSLTPTDDVRTFSGLLDLYHGKRGPFCAGPCATPWATLPSGRLQSVSTAILCCSERGGQTEPASRCPMSISTDSRRLRARRFKLG